MFCPQCGSQNAPECAFCSACGASLADQPAEQAAPQPVQEPPVQTYTPPQPKTPLSNHPVLNAVKTLGTSPVLLVAIVAFTAALLFQLFAAMSVTTSGVLGMLYDYAELLDVEELVGMYFDIIQRTTVVMTIIGMIPSILIAVGLWLTYTSARNRSMDGMKTSGLTIIKVINVIQMVLYNILMGLIALFLLIAAINAADSYYASTSETVLVVFLVLVLGIDVFVNLYYGKIIQTINTMKATIYMATPSYKVSSFVAVMCFISAFFSLFGLFSASGFFGVMQVLAAVTASSCFGAFLFQYKHKMMALISPVKQVGVAEGYVR